MMKIEEIKTIVKLMSENDLTEFKIESEDMTLCIKRGNSVPVAPVVTQAIIPAAAPAAAVAAAAPAVAAPAAAVTAAAPAVPASVPASPALADRSKIIESPIVGTFYRSNAPGGEALVQVGSKVTPDTTVCIVEAMKVMNEIKAEKTGIIKEILIENGQPVEYGQPLFILE